MTRYWIFDRDDTPRGFPLAKLVSNIRDVAGASGCELFVVRSQGYGLTVTRWDELLDDAAELSISLQELQEISSGKEQWFYDLEVRYVTSSSVIKFGLHDSTALFVDAPPELAQPIVAGFRDVRLMT